MKYKTIIPFPVTRKIFTAAVTLLANVVFGKVFNVRVPRGPLFVTWLPTYDCNVACKFCSTHTLKKRHPALLSLEKSLSLADEIAAAGAWVVGFSGGEALLDKNLFEIIKRLKQHGLVVYIVTNGLLLKEKAQDIIDAGVDYVTVSIDADTAEAHDRNRACPGLFDAARAGIQELRRCRTSQRPVIKTTTVVHKGNCEKLGKILDFLSQYADKVSVQPITGGYSDSPHGLDEKALARFMPEKAERKLIEQQFKALAVRYPLFKSSYVRGFSDYWFSPDKLAATVACWSPFLRVQIMPDGSVSHCLANPVYSSVGNVFEKSLLDIWNSEEMQRQRECIRQRKNDCTCWMQDTSFNALLHGLSIEKVTPILNRKPCDAAKK